MRIQSLLFLLLTNAALAQTTQPLAGGDDIVITLNGYCSNPPSLKENCKTTVTRAEFEQLSTSLQSDLSPAQLLTIANAYARNLRMAAVAEQRGIDKTARFEEQLRYARLQLLAQDLSQTLQTEASQISDADILQYYQSHQTDFEEAVFERIMVPHQGKTSTSNEAVMTELANDVRNRLRLGESADLLQREVYMLSATPFTSVNTRIEKIRRSSLPPNQEQVMALQTGEASAVISDPDGAHFIYKMVEKRVPELNEMRDDIANSISTQRYRDSTREFQGNTFFSDNYFNPPSNQSKATAKHGKSARKPSAPDQ